MATQSQAHASGSSAPVTWLSGALVTTLNKVVFPPIWLGVVVGVPLWFWHTTGSIHIAKGFYAVAAFAAAAAFLGIWVTLRVQHLGYSGDDLVVAGFWQEMRIPLREIAAVKSVWWNRGRLVRVEFRRSTEFGESIYYLPKWGALRAAFESPEDDLKAVIATAATPGREEIRGEG